MSFSSHFSFHSSTSLQLCDELVQVVVLRKLLNDCRALLSLALYLSRSVSLSLSLSYIYVYKTYTGRKIFLISMRHSCF